MQAHRLSRLIDRLALAGHPTSEAMVERGLRGATRRLGGVIGAAARLVAPSFPLHRLGEAFDEGLEQSKAAPPPGGRVLRFPGQR